MDRAVSTRENGTDAPVAGGKSSVFPEYERAAADLLWFVLNEMMFQLDPLLAQIQRVPASEIGTAPVAGEPRLTATYGAYRPIEMQCEFAQPFDDVLNVDTDAWAAMVELSASRAVPNLMKQMFEHMADICDASGQTIDARGRPPSIDLILDGYEKISIDFDENGVPKLPTIVMAPQMAERVRKLPPPTPEQIARFDNIIKEKKRAFDASRRVRKLD
jgi:hypothetical protein